MKKEFVKDEKGFTMIEIILSTLLVSVAILSLFMIIGEVNRVDALSKENHFAEKLIEPYISYYQNLEVTEDNVNILLSDVSRVDLIKENGKENVPSSFRNLDVECVNHPTLIGDDKYISFEISCEIDNQPINKGKPFIIKKYIQ